ncbi:hypothetical protein SHELI_v1c04190 [Spiroplasma helicoides]|uniref:Lipoprotein n=1 Tax=Spiroplasma helicoides TaxID=216938 RepID=A0A1B3SKB8_9MOLU|nr:hypothetical protein [Spiroplasma helicoides]AOG60370.1 hypothetical protein SHELI_v1c04190 [Spiroplasma helicoides]
MKKLKSTLASIALISSSSMLVASCKHGPGVMEYLYENELLSIFKNDVWTENFGFRSLEEIKENTYKSYYGYDYVIFDEQYAKQEGYFISLNVLEETPSFWEIQFKINAVKQMNNGYQVDKSNDLIVQNFKFIKGYNEAIQVDKKYIGVTKPGIQDFKIKNFEKLEGLKMRWTGDYEYLLEGYEVDKSKDGTIHLNFKENISRKDAHLSLFIDAKNLDSCMINITIYANRLNNKLFLLNNFVNNVELGGRFEFQILRADLVKNVTIKLAEKSKLPENIINTDMKFKYDLEQEVINDMIIVRGYWIFDNNEFNKQFLEGYWNTTHLPLVISADGIADDGYATLTVYVNNINPFVGYENHMKLLMQKDYVIDIDKRIKNLKMVFERSIDDIDTFKIRNGVIDYNTVDLTSQSNIAISTMEVKDDRDNGVEYSLKYDIMIDTKNGDKVLVQVDNIISTMGSIRVLRGANN